MNCPKCGSDMYDNRSTKTSPRQPDYKCKEYKNGCDGVIWPPKSTVRQTVSEYEAGTSAEPTGYERAKLVREQLTAPSPEERSRRIERQHSQEMAIRLLSLQHQAGMLVEVSREDVKELTDWFEQDLNQP